MRETIRICSIQSYSDARSVFKHPTTILHASPPTALSLSRATMPRPPHDAPHGLLFDSRIIRPNFWRCRSPDGYVLALTPMLSEAPSCSPILPGCHSPIDAKSVVSVYLRRPEMKSLDHVLPCFVANVPSHTTCSILLKYEKAIARSLGNCIITVLVRPQCSLHPCHSHSHANTRPPPSRPKMLSSQLLPLLSLDCDKITLRTVLT